MAVAEPLGARRFFRELAPLSPLRIISRCGPSTFEALCDFGPHGFAAGHLNAITPAYHWHLRLAGFRYLRARDEVHARSGRRVLFFELAEAEGADPFLLVYLHREKGAEFEPEREAAFLALHAVLKDGAVLAGGEE